MSRCKLIASSTLPMRDKGHYALSKKASFFTWRVTKKPKRHSLGIQKKSSSIAAIPKNNNSVSPVLVWWNRLTNIPKEYPFACQLGMATVKTSAADVVVQTTVEKKKLSEIDLRRNFTFLLFGLGYLGGFQYWLLIHKYKAWFPTMKRFGNKSLPDKLRDTAGMMDAAKMVAFDVIIHSPIIYFPTYYTVKESIGGTKWNPVEWIKDGLTKYRKNMKDDLIAMVKVTFPSDCIQVVMPLHTRMLFRHLVSFFWTAYISFSRGAMEAETSIRDDIKSTSMTSKQLELGGDTKQFVQVDES